MSSAARDLASVVIPCYNRAHLIVETLESVAAQSYSPIEVIVVDDGSTDDSVKVIKQWMLLKERENRHLVRLRCIQRENAGPSAARNSGIRECSGEFIQFLDSDDVLHPEKLAKQVSAIRQDCADFCVCNYQNFRETPGEAGPVVDFYHRPHSTDDFPEYYPMDTPAPLFRRDVVVKNGPWDEALDAGEDFEYNWRIMARGARGVWLDEVLLYVRKHNGVERRQATRLATRYRSMYLGLAKMEMEAIERGLCSKRLLNGFGVRAYRYYRHTRAEGSLPEAGMFLRYARSRLLWSTRIHCRFRQVLLAPVAGLAAAAKRLIRCRKR